MKNGAVGSTRSAAEVELKNEYTMKRMVVCAVFAFAVALLGCKKEKVLVDEIRLNAQKITLTVGEAKLLSAEVAPADAADKLIDWRTSDMKVVLVDARGKVTALGAGEAVVVAVAKDEGGAKAECAVTVLPKSDQQDSK